ncbi:LPS assembly lipoprotein LptE [Desulfocicer vacuolatum]|uniref:LPS assembly lipoprotein LptE n=1 Tax=Desulfocicer vacuolatum TaxID=2298 RepID=UPI001BAFA87B|nr:LPS assembly lipoprotein LptE [Desulfocicer vacuolatum]
MIIALLLGGCGYHIQGNTPLPAGIKAVHVTLFENRSGESGVENTFTDLFIDELLMKTDAKVTDEAHARGFVTGIIRSISVGDLTRSSDDAVLQGLVRATMDLSMADETGNVVWGVKGYSDSKVYTASSSNVTDESAKQEAVEYIARRLSEKLVSAMGDQW